MIIARPVLPGEPDLLPGFEGATLKLIGANGGEVARYSAPSSGWTHDALEALEHEFTLYQWDAYLGDQWIGSSEV